MYGKQIENYENWRVISKATQSASTILFSLRHYTYLVCWCVGVFFFSAFDPAEQFAQGGFAIIILSKTPSESRRGERRWLQL
jgi:hypothetical protein